jgi:hypothetical protein
MGPGWDEGNAVPALKPARVKLARTHATTVLRLRLLTSNGFPFVSCRHNLYAGICRTDEPHGGLGAVRRDGATQSNAFTARQSAQCGLRFNAAHGCDCRLRDVIPRLDDPHRLHVI